MPISGDKCGPGRQTTKQIQPAKAPLWAVAIPITLTPKRIGICSTSHERFNNRFLGFSASTCLRNDNSKSRERTVSHHRPLYSTNGTLRLCSAETPGLAISARCVHGLDPQSSLCFLPEAPRIETCHASRFEHAWHLSSVVLRLAFDEQTAVYVVDIASRWIVSWYGMHYNGPDMSPASFRRYGPHKIPCPLKRDLYSSRNRR